MRLTQISENDNLAYNRLKGQSFNPDTPWPIVADWIQENGGLTNQTLRALIKKLALSMRAHVATCQKNLPDHERIQHDYNVGGNERWFALRLQELISNSRSMQAEVARGGVYPINIWDFWDNYRLGFETDAKNGKMQPWARECAVRALHETTEAMKVLSRFLS